MIPPRAPATEEKQAAKMTVLERLGDQGVLARFDDEDQAACWADAVRRLDAVWVLDVVQAYTTVAVFHDPQRLSLTALVAVLGELTTSPGDGRSLGRLHQLPCCYERGPDLLRVAQRTGLPVDEVVRLHASVE